MKLKTIKLFMAVLCVLLFGVSNAMAGTLKVAAGIETVATGPQQNYTTYTSYFNSVTLPGQEEINQKGLGQLIYYANDHILYFNGVHRKSVTEILKPYFDYDETLTIELHGENELTIEQAREANAKIFSGDIKIVGDGSLKLNLKAYNKYSHVGAVKRIDMQGTGVVEINLIDAYDDENTYAATSVHLQEGMMLSTAGYSNGPSAMGYDPTRYVFRKNGGLDYSRQDESWYSNTAWYNEHGAKWLRIEPLKKYNLYIAGKQVNWINMEDILGDGHVSYQPYSSTPGSTQGGLITLNNADIHYEYDGTNMPRIFEHSSVSDAANHVAGVHPNMLDIKLVGKNKITGVVNSQLNSETSFFGFPRMARFSGSGTLRMELSANKAAEGGVYGFGTLGAITGNTVVLQDSFTGWVSVSTSNVGTNPASVFMNNARYLVLPDGNYSDYFIARGNTLPVVARTNVARQNKDLNVAHVNFGKKDGSAAPTGTITRPLIQMAYVGKTLADNTLGLEVTGGQGPFYYSATGLQDGLSINPENGCVSGTYTTANTPASGAQTTFTVTDFQGRQTTVSANRQEVVEKLTINDSDSEILTLKPKWAEGVAIEQIDLSKKFSGGKAPYTYYALSATLNQGRTTLPTGVSFDKSTGVISGTPTERMEYNYGIVVEDYVGQKVLFNVQGNVAENYGFSVAGVPVTGYNKDNILIADHHLDYDLIQGNISYDPTSKKLILDRLKVEFEVYDNDIAEDFFIILNDQNAFDGQPINVHVKGACSIMVDNKYDGEAQFIFPRSIIVTGENSGNETPKLTLGGIHGGCVLDAVDGDVVVNGNVLLDFSTFSIPINGNLTIPADQVVYINDSANPANGGIPGDGAYTYNIGDNGDVKHIVTAPHPNGALGFTNKKESKTIYNTVPVKPFTMFDVVGGEAPYSYSATSLPSGLTIDATTGYISGTSTLGNKDVTVTFTVTDAMGREINTDMNLTVKNPSLAATKYGGSKPGYGETGSWTTVVSTSLDEGQILFVKSNFDLDETAIEVPKNIVLRDVNGKMLAGDIDLKDGVKYAFPYEVEAQSISYTRSFSDAQKGKWQALYVPFAFNVADYAEDFDVAEIYAICPTKDTNGDGVVDAEDDKVMILSFVKNGDTQANAPYMIRPKKAAKVTIESENELLHKATINSVEFSTSRTKYTVNGIYSTFVATPRDNNYYMSGGKFSWATTANISVSPNRWYMHEESKSYIGNDTGIDSESKPISIHVIGEDFDEATAIRLINAEFDLSNSNTGIYNLNGMKMDEAGKLPRGIYIKKGKKVVIK